MIGVEWSGWYVIPTQSTHLKKDLDRFDMTDCKPTSLPMNPGVANSLQPFDGTADPKSIKWYQSTIGSLLWPAVHTRPDIAYSVGVQYLVDIVAILDPRIARW